MMNMKGKAEMLTSRNRPVRRPQIQQQQQPVQEKSVQEKPVQEQPVEQKRQIQYTRNPPLMKLTGAKRDGIKMSTMIYSNGRFGGG